MSMEALSTSSHISNLPQIKPLLKSSRPSSQSPCWLCNPRIPNLRISDGSSHVGLRIQALSHNNDTPSDEGDAAESSGLGDIFSLSQIPGWSGLSNARVTLFGDVYPLSEDEQEWAHKQYSAKHHHGPSEQWGNFHYFRMHNISDIYFIGGFGTVAWVDVKEYEALQPDKIAVDGGEQNLKVLHFKFLSVDLDSPAILELNAIFSKPLRELLSIESEVDDAALISIDSKGIDVRVRQGAQFSIQRLAFEEGHGVETLEEAKAALWKVMENVKLNYLQK
ncbi:hypothetical protein YC2023_005332 [Brassica napus]